jgi:hypothetical protein
MGRVHFIGGSPVSSIHTIGFPKQECHLAAALEVFLIRRFDGLRNKQWRHARQVAAVDRPKR